MRYLKPSLIFLLGSFVGVSVSAVIGYFVVSFFIYGSKVSTAATMQTRITTLRMLREGEADKAISVLEQLVDSDVLAVGMDLGFFDNSIENTQKALSEAREYREAYPRITENPEWDNEVQNALYGQQD